MNRYDFDSGAEKFWEQAKRDLSHHRKLVPHNAEELRREFDESPEVHISEAEIESIVDQVVSEALATWKVSGDFSVWLEDVDSQVGEAALTNGLMDHDAPIDDGSAEENQKQRIEGEENPPDISDSTE